MLPVLDFFIHLPLVASRGVILSPAVIPIALTVTWRKLTAIAVCLGAILGAILALTAWIIGCWKIYGMALIVLRYRAP